MKNPFLRATLVAAPFLLGTSSAFAQSVRVVKAPPAVNSSGFYVGNRAPLQPSPFLKLPPGAISPRGWLKRQLELDATGLSRRLPEISDFLKYEGNGWVDPNRTAVGKNCLTGCAVTAI